MQAYSKIGRTKALKAVLIATRSLGPNVLLIRPNTRFALPTMSLIWASHLKEDSIQIPRCLCLSTADRFFSFITYWWTKGHLDLVTCRVLHFSAFSVTGHPETQHNHLQMRCYDKVHCHQQKALYYSLHLGGSHLYTAGKEVALIYSLDGHQIYHFIYRLVF